MTQNNDPADTFVCGQETDAVWSWRYSAVLQRRSQLSSAVSRYGKMENDLIVHLKHPPTTAFMVCLAISPPIHVCELCGMSESVRHNEATVRKRADHRMIIDQRATQRVRSRYPRAAAPVCCKRTQQAHGASCSARTATKTRRRAALRRAGATAVVPRCCL